MADESAEISCSDDVDDIGRMSLVEIAIVPPLGVNLQALLEKCESLFLRYAETNLVRLVTICLNLVSSPVTIPSTLGCFSRCIRTVSGDSPRASYDACLET